MKPRNAEAARLEADYMARLDAALSGEDPADTAEIAQSIKEHVEAAATEHDGVEVTLVQMANIFERLGPPESYAADDGPVPGSQAQAAMATPQMVVARFDKRGAAWWSFICILASPVLMAGVAAGSLGPLFFVAACAAVGISVVMGRLALLQRALPGQPLPRWLGNLAGVGPVLVGGAVFLMIFLVLPWLSFYLFERAGMGAEGKFFGEPFMGGDHDLPFLGAGCVYAVTVLVVILLVKYQAKLLRVVFFPVFERLEPGHWKWLLIPMAAGLMVAGIKLARFLQATS